MSYERPLEPPESKERIAFKCELCEDEIYEGETYYDIPGVGICCETCIDECRRYDAEAPSYGCDLREEAMLDD